MSWEKSSYPGYDSSSPCTVSDCKKVKSYERTCLSSKGDPFLPKKKKDFIAAFFGTFFFNFIILTFYFKMLTIDLRIWTIVVRLLAFQRRILTLFLEFRIF